MRFSDKRIVALSALIAASAFLPAAQAEASAHKHHAGSATHHAAGASHHHVAVASVRHRHAATSNHRHYAARRGAHVIQCVAFAKQDAGIQISGNARDWWSHAAGVYERGSRPEPGSVLSFQANRRMPLGHVAVVASVADSRTIIIDQSHWNSRGITRNMVVRDVSDNNDWSAVRVQLSHGGAFGSIYATHGFIYPRPDSGVMQTNYTSAQLVQPGHATLEVAEAPNAAAPVDGIMLDAPNRGIH